MTGKFELNDEDQPQQSTHNLLRVTGFTGKENIENILEKRYPKKEFKRNNSVT